MFLVVAQENIYAERNLMNDFESLVFVRGSEKGDFFVVFNHFLIKFLAIIFFFFLIIKYKFKKSTYIFNY